MILIPDEDECRLSSLNDCDVHATCENQVGYYTCSCDEGFIGTGFTDNCTDVDECESEEHNCSTLAVCTNTEGSYKCECIDGYIGDGVICYGEYL